MAGNSRAGDAGARQRRGLGIVRCDSATSHAATRTGQLNEGGAPRRHELSLQHRVLASSGADGHDSALHTLVDQVQEAAIDPYTAVRQILADETLSYAK